MQIYTPQFHDLLVYNIVIKRTLGDELLGSKKKGMLNETVNNGK